MIANTLVDLNRCADKVPVRVLNPNANDVWIKKGVILGNLQEAIQVIPFEDDQIQKSSKSESSGTLRVNNVAINKDLPDKVQDLYNRASANLTDEQGKKVYDVLCENTDLFATSPSDLGKSSIVEHKINTGNARPIKQAARRPPKTLFGEEDEIIQEQMKAGVIRESTSPWASPMVYVLKKDGTIRPCVDYRKLNEVTLKDAYPLPRINDCLDNFGNAKFLSTLDLQSGYWQISVAEDKPKTAFVTRSGLYEYNMMPFGFCNAPGTFQRCMEIVFRGLQWKVLLIYLNDIIIHSETFESHGERLNEVFSRLRKAGFKLKPAKCELFRPEVTFLGHSITNKGVKPSPEKVRVIQNWKRPMTVTQVRSFLGFASYYRRYIRNFSVRAAPLNRLLEAGQAFVWTDEIEDAFNDLKFALTGEEVMAFPRDDGLLVLDTDASDSGIGAVLSQMQFSEATGKEEERPISFASKSLLKTQRRYCVTRREMLAVVTFVQHFKQYLLGRKFVIRTDHSASRWILSFKEPENQMARWIEILAQFEFTIIHRQGIKHRNADSLLRMCEPSACDCYDGQTILADLPCGGCDDCLKKHEQWSTFMKVDNIVPLKRNQVRLDGENQSKNSGQNKNLSWNIMVSKCTSWVPIMLVIMEYLFLWSQWTGSFLRKTIGLSNDVGKVKERVYNLKAKQQKETVDICSGKSENDGPDMHMKLPSYVGSYSSSDLAKMHQNDPEIGTLIKWKLMGDERPSRETAASESPYTRHLWLLWSQLLLIDGVLYKMWYPKLKGQQFLQLIAPRKIWRELLEATHNSKFSGHLGVKKVLSKLILNFYWFRMKEYVTLWIKKCVVCGARKCPRKKSKGPFGVIHCWGTNGSGSY